MVTGYGFVRGSSSELNLRRLSDGGTGIPVEESDIALEGPGECLSENLRGIDVANGFRSWNGWCEKNSGMV